MDKTAACGSGAAGACAIEYWVNPSKGRGAKPDGVVPEKSAKDKCGWGCIMEIGLTEAVRKMTSAGALPAAQEGELLFCWDLARVDFGQRKLLVASNAATRLCAITRMAAADWRRIDEVALRLVEDAVGCAGLDAARYLALAGEVRLSKTHGRRALGCMNDLSRMLDPTRIDMGEKLQWREMELFNCRFISKCAGHDGYGVPAERFVEDLRVLIERSWRLLSPSGHLQSK